MSIDNKVFPIYEGAQLRRRFTTEEEWKDWLRAHGAYGFRVAPYYSRCVVVFGADRYVETMKQLYGVDDSEFIGDAGGWVTDMGYFEADRSVHGVFLPDVRDEKRYGMRRCMLPCRPQNRTAFIWSIRRPLPICRGTSPRSWMLHSDNSRLIKKQVAYLQ
jgi:hypothetical protein